MVSGICSGPHAENHRRQWGNMCWPVGRIKFASLALPSCPWAKDSVSPQFSQSGMQWNAERKKKSSRGKSMETRLRVQIQTPSSLVLLRLRRSQAAAGPSVSLHKLWLQIMAACRHRLCDLPRELHFLRAFLIYL
jgi:hypothetical protein